MAKILSSLGLVAIGIVLMGAASTRPFAKESRPRLVQVGVVLVSVDRQSAAINPLRYLVNEVDGPWLEVTLLKKKRKEKKGKPFWLRLDDIGPFMVE